MLIGRESECARTDDLLERARTGQSAALAIRGEAGIGKTALLEYAVERATAGMTVVRALGVESEAELEFSGLLEVCWPLRKHLEDIPPHQADALRAALGLEPSEAPDRFAVGAAALSLFAAAAEAAPLLVVVDDAQSLDRSSLDALLFAMRRLRADRVAFLFAARDGEDGAFEAPGVASLPLIGVPREAAISLLRRSRVPDVAPAVADRLYDATGGNPLALLELPGLLSRGQLAGAEPLADPLPAGSIERAFLRRARALPGPSRTALLVAAASTSSEAAPVLAALAALGLSREALEPVEHAGLVRVSGGRLAFLHPLVRSAAYHAAAPSDRRSAHRALAEALAATPHLDERAWHLASAAVGPDEEAAAALVQAADEARRRGGHAAAAAAFERAARLSPDRAAAAGRLADAAAAAWRAGQTAAAARLVDESLRDLHRGRRRAEALRARGAIEFFAGRGAAAAEAFLEAVALLEELDTDAAVAAAADAANALVRARRPEQAVEVAQRARALEVAPGSAADVEATVALGYGLCFARRYGEAAPQLRRAVELFDATSALPSPLQAGRLSAAMGWLGRHEQAHAYLAETVRRARRAGAVGSLPHLLASSAWQALHAGRWNEASADAGEAAELADETGQPVTAAQALGVLSWVHALRGDDARCRAYADETRRRAEALGFRLYGLLASLCVALLEVGSGRVAAAIGRLEEVARYADERGVFVPGVSPQLELAEAYARAGQSGEAEAILATFDRSELASVPLFAAHAARCRGLLADADGFEPHFENALELHAEVESPFALARTRLCCGEQLRRAGRRIDARDQLRLALEAFEHVGARPWADRARRELRATGETLRRREPHEAEQLTPQELQIALQVAEGKTNKEVAAALFLSHKTVEFHLSRIYRKLDLTSRAELIRLLAAEPALPMA